MKKQDVISYFGNQEKTALALGVKQASVSNWGEEIPELRTYQVERLIAAAKDNKVELSQLRIGKDGRVICKLKSGEMSLPVHRELTRLSSATETARG